MTLIGLEYLKHKESVRSNKAKEANTVLDIETRAHTADKDREVKVQEGSLDRAVKYAEMESKEGIAQRELEHKKTENQLDREFKGKENALDREQDILKQRAKNFSDAGYMAVAESVLNPGVYSDTMVATTDILNRGYNDIVAPVFRVVTEQAAKNLAPKQQKVFNTNNTFNQQHYNQSNTVNQNYGSVMNQKLFYP